MLKKYFDPTIEAIHTYNDYSCLELRNSCTGKLVHYTTLKGCLGIIDNRLLYAKLITEFKNDENEGVVSLSNTLELINKGIIKVSEEEEKIIKQHLEKKESIKKFAEKFPTYVTCFCSNLKSDYMENRFHSDAVNEGTECKIIFDENKIYNNLYLLQKENHTRKGNCIDLRNVIYDVNEQKKILEEEIKKLWNILEVCKDLWSTERRIELLLSKVYYLGTYFKIPDPVKSISAEEEEVRATANIATEEETDEKGRGLLPEKFEDGKRINLHFDLECIEKVVIFEAKNSNPEEKILIDNIEAVCKKYNIVFER